MSALGASVSGIPKFVIYLGKVSYGLYVFHELALSAMTALRQHIEQSLFLYGGAAAPLFAADRIGGLGITIAAGALSYKFLEKPFLNLKSRVTFVRSRPV
jgi:peptidoglycan/LPS O-acetylase OafA/YrhL